VCLPVCLRSSRAWAINAVSDFRGSSGMAAQAFTASP
jgi:hypothetical protein